MAVGRITGPLLARNLVRDGVDLSFETDLLYLDVTNGRIGIKTNTPDYTLDVNGDTNLLALRVATTSTLGALQIYSTTASTNLINTQGDIVIQAPTEKIVRVNNDVLVSGNVHATGNITANGSVQIGNNTGSDTLSLYADIISDITPQSPSNYNLGAEGKEWANAYVDSLIANAIVGSKANGGEINITPEPGKFVNIYGNVRIWGKDNLGVGPATQNTLYVNMDGSDTNDGRTNDPAGACRTISGAIRSPFYKSGTSIKVAAGRYLENNPIELLPYTSVIGSDLRTTMVEPINKTQDLFWVDSGCYIAQMMMANGQSGLLPGSGYISGTNRGAYATAFRPNFGGAKIDLYHSPYIQNCTNQSGPWLYDGTMFNPNQTVQVPEAVATATWVTNTTTLLVHVEEGALEIGQTINIGPTKQGYVNARTLMLANKAFFQEQVIAYIDQKYEYFGYDQVKCERDTGLIVDSIVMDLLFPGNGYTQSNFSGLQYWNQDGYTGDIADQITTTTNAFLYAKRLAQKVVLNVTTGTRYQSTLTQILNTASIATVSEQTTIGEEFDLIINIINTGTAGVTDLVEPNLTSVVSANTQKAANLIQANKAYIQAETIAYINALNPGFTYDNATCYRDVGFVLDCVTFDVLYGGNRQAIQAGVYYYGFSNTQTAIPNEVPQTTAAFWRIRDIVDELVINETVTKSPGNVSNQVTNLPAATETESLALQDMIDLITEIIAAGPEAALTPAPISLTKTSNANKLKAAEIIKANKAFIVAEVIGYIEARYNNGFAYNKVKCARDTGLIVDSIAVDLLFDGVTQSAFAGLQYWNQDQYTGLIETQVTATIAAINYAGDLAQRVILNNSSGTRYQSTVTQTIGFAFDETKCSRDTGLIVDSLSLDLLFNGNSQSTFAGVQYWNHGSYVGDIANELTTTTNAINYVSFLAQKVIINDITGTRYQSTVTQTSGTLATVAEQVILSREFSTITNILINGVAGITDKIVPNGINVSTTTSVVNAYNTLLANKTYIQAEAVAFVESTKTVGFVYDKVKCYRDVGYMIDSVAFDLLYGGNLQAITSGAYYYGYNATSTALPGEQTQAVGAYNYLKALMPYIITGTAIPSPYQSAVAQVTTGPYGTGSETTSIQSDIDIITNIITNGPSVAAAPSPIGLTRSTNANVINATTILRANRNFLRAEIIAYINAVYGNVATTSEVGKVSEEFGIITGIISNGTLGVTDLVEPNGLPTTTASIINAYNLLQDNKSYIQAEAVAFVNSFFKIFDTDKCARDTGLIVDAVAQDLLFTTSSQSTFAGLQYWNQAGYTSGIIDEITTTTNAINWVKTISAKVVINDVLGTRYSLSTQQTGPAATGSEQTKINDDFDVLLDIITAGTDGVTDIIVPNNLTVSPDPNVIKAYNLLQANRQYIIDEAIAYVETVKPVEFVYDQTKCARDVGYIVDSVSFDLLYGGNRQAVQAGVYYYGFSGTQSAIQGEIANTKLAYNYLRSLLPYVIQGVSYPTPAQTAEIQVLTGTTGTTVQSTIAQASIDLITNIIEKGPSQAGEPSPMPLTASVNMDVIEAATKLSENRDWLVAEVIAYISNPSSFVYDAAKCYRDVGFIIDSISFDLLHGGNRQAVTSGVYYYNFDGTSSAIVDQIPQTTAAYNHIRRIVSEIVTNQSVTPTSGNTATQVFLTSTATSIEVANIYQKIEILTDIINQGPGAAPTKEPISLTMNTSTSVRAAYNLLIANREFIQNEVTAFVDQFTTGFVYNRAKCRRDVGIVVENLAYDIAFGGNEKSREAGLAYWNGVTSYISNEITETADAFNYLDSLIQDVITNTTSTNLLNTFQLSPQVINTVLTGGGVADSTVTKLIDIINDIIVNGPEVAPTVQIGNGPDWGSISAEVLLQSNRQFIQNEVLAWIGSTYPTLEYREDKCYRDTGLIIDAITQDIILNANAKTIEAGVTYWTGNESVLENASYGDKNQVVETIAAINHAKDVALQVIQNNTVSTTAFVFNSAKCSRDTRLIVDALAQDLLFGSDSQTTFAGIQYWNQEGYIGDITQQLTTTTAAINYISSLAQKVVQNITSGVRYQSTVSQITTLTAATSIEANAIAANFSTITNILISGTVGITDQIIPNNLTASTTVNTVRAYNLLRANLEYFKAEAIGFVDATKNFNYDQVKCYRDTGLIVDSIVLDLKYPTSNYSQSTFAGLQYWNQAGYTGTISAERDKTLQSINYLNELAQRVVQNDLTGVRYQSDVQQVIESYSGSAAEASTLDTEFNIIYDIIQNGTTGATDLIIPNNLQGTGDPIINNAYLLLQSNKAYMKAEVIAFVEATKEVGFEYDPTLCARDVGYMIDSISFDLLHGGNRQAVMSGIYYYNFSEASSAIDGQSPQTLAAYQYIKALSEKIVQNIPVTPLQTNVAQDFSGFDADPSIVSEVFAPIYKILGIIENGPDVVSVKQPISLVSTTNGNAAYAAERLDTNREFIQAEVIAYVNNYLQFQYDPVTCARDIGYIVDSVSFDLLYGGNRQSIQSGVYYWGYTDNSTSLPKERVATTLAYQFMKELISDVITATPREAPYQGIVTQTTGLPSATDVEVSTIGTNIDKITTIINEGPQVAGAKRPITLTESNNQFVRNAVNLLSANREFIAQEVVAYVAATQVSNDQVILPFYDKGANATLSVIRNFGVLTNIVENGPGVAPIISDGNGIFVKTGLSVDDILSAPKVVSITTVSNNVYQINIDQSTIGYGDAQSLYFGQTLVFPLKDNQVPDRWQQRRVNPIGSMGGSLVDGGVISDISPIQSFVYDAFTQVNQGGEGVRITNNGYAQLVSVFTIFCSRSVVVENGGIASITNSNANFGDTCLTAKGYGRRDFSGYIKNPPVLPYYPNGVYPEGGQVVVYVADPELRPHISLVMEVQPPVGFINNQGLPGFLSGQTNIDTLTTGTIDISPVDTTGFCIGQAFYIVDQFGKKVDNNNQPYVRPGTIVADVNYQTITLNFPLNSGGGEVGNNNFFNLYSCGNAYYTVISSVLAPDPVTPGQSLLPNQQNVQEAMSLDYINSLSQYIVTNTAIPSPLTTASNQVFDNSLVGGAGANAFISSHLDIIGNILVSGPNSSPKTTVTGTLPSGGASAASLLRKNRSFIQDEVIAYTDQTFFTFTYDEAKCARDTGLIVDALAQDLLFRTSSQSTFAGLQYWNQDQYTGDILAELSTTTAAISYARDLAKEVIKGVIGTRYSTATQVTNLTIATTAEADTIGTKFNTILNILNTGTAGVTDIIVPNSLTSSTNINVKRAYDLLQANKTYIQQEVVAFVEDSKPGFKFNTPKCRRDAGLIVEALALELAFPTTNNSQATFAGLQYWNQGTLSFPGEYTTTTAAISYIKSLAEKVVVNDISGTRYSAGTQVTSTGTGAISDVAKITEEFDLILNILNTGTAGITDLVDTGGITASKSTTTIAAYNLLQANKSYIQTEAIAYINSQNPGFVYDTVDCSRDVGYIINSISFDLLYGGNRQAIQSAVYYYDFNGSSSAIVGEVSTTTDAFNYLASIAAQVATNTPVTLKRQQTYPQIITTSSGGLTEATEIQDDIDLINNIITNGPGVAPTKEPISLVRATGAALNAAQLLLLNKDFLVNETLAYIGQTTGFWYDQELCYRDVGYMIDSVSVDLLYGGNRQSIQSGVYYWGYNSTSTAISGEIPQTVDAYKHIATLTEAIILGTPITAQQSLVPRVTGTGATVAESNVVKDLISNIAKIISAGPNAVVVGTPLPTTVSTDAAAINSAKILDANREFIVAETIAYIETELEEFYYDQTKCERDTGLIVDAIAQDLMFASSSQSTFAGVQYWNHGSYVGDIAGELTTTTNAVNFVKGLAQKVILNDKTGARYQSGIVQDTSNAPATSGEVTLLATDFTVITNILTNGVAGVTNIIVPNSLTASTTANVQNAFASLLANKPYIQAEAVAYVEATKTSGFTYDQELCYRDVGYMIDAVLIDLLYGGNKQAVQAGVYYYSFNATSTALPAEQAQAVAAYNYIKSILPNIITGTTIGAPKQATVPQVTSGTAGNLAQAEYAQAKVDIITTIITNGPRATDNKRPLGVTRSINSNIVNAAALIDANREWIVAETIAYINKKYKTYNREKCRRDVGLLVDALTYDLEKGGNYNAIIAGRSYYAEAGTHHLVQLEENVTDPALFPDGAICTFYQRSYMSASGYLFEYVGAGTNYGSLPQRGVKDPVQSKETVQLNNGKVFFTSTDQNGDFRIGTGLVISQATGVLSGRTFTKSLFANLTPFILAIEG